MAEPAPRSLAVMLAGSWLRVLTLIGIAGNLVIVALALWVLLGGDRQSLFRIDARTDKARFVTQAELRWGPGPVYTRTPLGPDCREPALRLPPGTTVELRRGSGGAAVQVKPPTSAAIGLDCGPDDLREQTFVELRPPASSSSVAARFVVPIAGTALSIGGGPDADSPITATQILRSGAIVSEADSWPFESARISETPELHPGEIVSLDRPGDEPGEAGMPAAFTGLLMIDGDGARIISRSRGAAVYVTETDAPEGEAAVVAPTMLARVQAQAEWGIFLVIGWALLGCLAALRTQIVERERMFDWTKPKAAGKPPAPPSPPAPAPAPARKRRASRSRAAKAAALLLCCAIIPHPSAEAQQLADQAVFRIEGPSGIGQGFAIANPRGTPRCLIVTVAHVAQPGDAVMLVGELPNTIARQAAALRAPARYLDTLAPGLIVLEPTGPQDLGACAPLAQPERADALFEGDDVGRLSFVDPTGERRTLRVVVEGDPRLNRLLRAQLVTDSQIGPGMSGSPLSIKGRILALAEQVNSGSTEITRIDAIKVNPRYIGAQAGSAVRATRTAWAPFDFGRLPQPYLDAARAANAIAKEADAIQQVARQNAKAATDTLPAARSRQPGYGRSTHTDADRIFEGQIGADGVASGWGVLRYISGDHDGAEYQGFFRRTATGFQSSGAIVAILGAANVKLNQHKFEGVINENGWDGLGVLTFTNGDVVWGKWTKNKTVDHTLYYRKADGAYFYTGRSPEGNFHGPGVMYTNAGQPSCICVWDNGVVDKNETDAILAASQ